MCIRITFIILLALASAESNAQFWKKKKKAEPEYQTQTPTSLNPYDEGQDQKRVPPAAKSAKASTKGPTYGLEQQYYERMEELAKVRRKNEKLMEKPQYSDPSYFGHKRPPKKRKPSKMKFCKECGIRH